MKKSLFVALLPALFGCVEQIASLPAPAGGECVFTTDFDGCNGRDDDCDGLTDEDCERTDAGSPDHRPDQLPRECQSDSDCADSDPCTLDLCSSEGCVHVNQCEPCRSSPTSDCDEDGATPAAGDCDDNDASRSPLIAEDAEHGNLGDGKDNDCDSTADEWGFGLDSDGDAIPDRTDCDPHNPLRWTGAPEICDDGVDSDCNGSDNTDAWGSCVVPVGILDGLVINPLVRVAVTGNITSGLIDEPEGTIFRISVGSEETGWSTADDEWAPWRGNGETYALQVLHSSDFSFNFRVQARGPVYFDLRKWQVTGTLRKVPSKHGRWGVNLIAP